LTGQELARPYARDLTKGSRIILIGLISRHFTGVAHLTENFGHRFEAWSNNLMDVTWARPVSNAGA